MDGCDITWYVVFSYDQWICIPNWNQLTKVYTLVYLHQPEFPSTFSRVTSLFDCHGIAPPVYQPCTRFCHRLEASLQQVSPAIWDHQEINASLKESPLHLNWSNCNNLCRFVFLILASKSNFNIFHTNIFIHIFSTSSVTNLPPWKLRQPKLMETSGYIWKFLYQAIIITSGHPILTVAPTPLSCIQLSVRNPAWRCGDEPNTAEKPKAQTISKALHANWDIAIQKNAEVQVLYQRHVKNI